MTPYTGPWWVTPLFKWLGVGVLVFLFTVFFVDTEKEFECNGD
jgi:hypothetical protein